MFVKIFAGGDAWLPGQIADITGPVSYKVTLIENRIVRRHADHIFSRTSEMEVVNDNDELENQTSVTVNAENIAPTSTPEASQASGASQPPEMSQEASQPQELRHSSCSASA